MQFASSLLFRYPEISRLLPAVMGLLAGLATAWVSGFTSAYVVPLLLVGLVFLAISLQLPEVSVGCAVCVSVLFTREQLFEYSLPFLGGGLKPPDVLLLLVFGGFALRAAFGRSALLSNVPGGAVVAVGLFLGWSLLSSAMGIVRGVPYKDSLVELRPLLQYLLFYPIAAELNQQQIFRVSAAVYLCCVAIALKALYEYSQGVGQMATYTEAGVVRVMSVEFSYLVFGVVAGLALWLERRWSTGAMVIAVGLTAGGLVVTFYRAAAAGLAAAVVFLALFTMRGGRSRLLRLTATGLALGAFAAPIVVQVFPGVATTANAYVRRMLSVKDYQRDTSAQHRLNEWAASMSLIEARPWTGHGLGTRIRFYSPMYHDELRTSGYQSNDFYTHNSYVWTLTKMGIIGLTLLAVILLYVLLLGTRFLWRAHDQGLGRTVVLALGGCWLAVIVLSVFGPTLSTPNVAPFVGFGLGATIVLTRPFPSQERLPA